MTAYLVAATLSHHFVTAISYAIGSLNNVKPRVEGDAIALRQIERARTDLEKLRSIFQIAYAFLEEPELVFEIEMMLKEKGSEGPIRNMEAIKQFLHMPKQEK